MKQNSDEFKKYAVKHLGMNSLTLDGYAKYNQVMMNSRVPIIQSTIAPSAPVANAGTVQMPIGMTPYIMEERQMNVAQVDVFSRLMMDRIIFLGMGIDSQVANIIIAQLLFLESADPKKDATIYLNTPGGSVYDGLAIHDTMNLIRPDVATVVTGMAASMGFVLTVSGAKGKRSALKHSRLMQHQPLGGAEGQASDIEITAKQITLLKKELYEIIAENTGQKYDKIYADCDRDYWMTSAEAKAYGAIDTVIEVAKQK